MATVTREPLGRVGGMDVERINLVNANGVAVEIRTLGGAIDALWAPDRDGKIANVALGYDTPAAALIPMGAYFGCITGRWANRIAGGRFTLDGQSYQLACNNGPNALHGGERGFDKYVWELEVVPNGVRLSRTSPDGEEHFPGTLVTTVTYTLDANDALRIDYRAETDKPTIINLTNHGYWNLAGEGTGTIEGHELRLAASRYTPVDDDLIPTGELAPVAGTPFDFTASTRIGARLRDRHPQMLKGGGYDHNFVFDRPDGDASLMVVGELYHPVSGRLLTISTTEPGIQLYTANHLDGSQAGTSGRSYRQSDGVALETQHFPDSPNQLNFPSTVLRPGEVYTSTTIFALGVR